MENPTSDEKVLAALAHASVLFSFFGPVGPTFIWVYQRDKSKYVRFHALQAMGYQAFAFWLWFIGIFVVVFGSVILMVVVEGILSAYTSGDATFAPFILQPLIFLGIFGLWGLFFAIGMIGAIFCMINRDFSYPFIGHWLKTKLFDDRSTDMKIEEWEDNWVSGVCHATAILQFWGIITPLIVWFTQKERSARIRFQALQATFYQLIAVIGNILGFAVYMLFIFLFFAGMLALGSVDPSVGHSTELSPVWGLFILIFTGGIMIFWLFFMIAVPVYFLLSAVAAIRTMRGHDFKYPILGSIIANRLQAIKKEAVVPS